MKGIYQSNWLVEVVYLNFPWFSIMFNRIQPTQPHEFNTHLFYKSIPGLMFEKYIDLHGTTM